MTEVYKNYSTVIHRGQAQNFAEKTIMFLASVGSYFVFDELSMATELLFLTNLLVGMSLSITNLPCISTVLHLKFCCYHV